MFDYRYSESNSRGQPFRTPNAIQFNYEDIYSYGSEMNTASANYRPGNSNTMLRRRIGAADPRNGSGPNANNPSRPLRSSMKKQNANLQKQSEKSAQMDPAEDSFHVSPIKSQKYADSKSKDPIADDKVVGKRPTSNVTLSGVSEFDYLGDDSNEKDKPADADDAPAAEEPKDEQEVEFDEDGAIQDYDPARKSLEKEF